VQNILSEVVGLRMTRYERNRKRSTIGKLVIVLFLIIVPLAAFSTSIFIMNMYNKGNGIEASANELPSKEIAAFKYNFEIESKIFYRLVLNRKDSFEEAEAYVKSIKAKKLNGFVLKEDGYMIIYGVFADYDEASNVKGIIESKVQGSIAENKLPGYSLKYNEADSTFIQLVEATDKLIWEAAKAKSLISQELALKSKKDNTAVIEEISRIETKLEKYLGYAKEIEVTKEQMHFRDNFVILLEEVLASKLDNDKDYYKIQGSLLNQLEVYRKFIDKLSV
jgi:hypothetical protein